MVTPRHETGLSSHLGQSAQCETERRRQSEQVEALRRSFERLSAENYTLVRLVERLDGRMTPLAEYCGTLVERSRGRWIRRAAGDHGAIMA